MIGFLLKIAGNAAALYLAAHYIDGFTFTGNVGMLAWAGVWITFGSYAKSILKLITLPLSLISLGIFGALLDLVASAAILWGLAVWIEPLTIGGIGPLLWGTVFVGIASGIISFVVKRIW